jgi:hypothetical protein
MDKRILVALAVLVVLAVVLVSYNGRKKERSLTFKAPSGKTATVTVK